MPDRQLITIDHQGLQALVAVPENHKGVPLLCFLHGRDEAAPAEIGRALTKFGPLNPQAASAMATDFLIVAPQLPLAGDLWHLQAETVQTLVLGLQAKYGTDPARRYLSGFSFGGNGVFDLALMQADFWAALWPVDPTRWPPHDLDEPVWLSIGSCARLHEKEFVARLRSQPSGQELSAASIHLDQGEDHVGCAERAYADPLIYEWLLAHPRRQH